MVYAALLLLLGAGRANAQGFGEFVLPEKLPDTASLSSALSQRGKEKCFVCEARIVESTLSEMENAVSAYEQEGQNLYQQISSCGNYYLDSTCKKYKKELEWVSRQAQGFLQALAPLRENLVELKSELQPILAEAERMPEGTGEAWTKLSSIQARLKLLDAPFDGLNTLLSELVDQYNRLEKKMSGAPGGSYSYQVRDRFIGSWYPDYWDWWYWYCRDYYYRWYYYHSCGWDCYIPYYFIAAIPQNPPRAVPEIPSAVTNPRHPRLPRLPDGPIPRIPARPADLRREALPSRSLTPPSSPGAGADPTSSSPPQRTPRWERNVSGRYDPVSRDTPARSQDRRYEPPLGRTGGDGSAPRSERLDRGESIRQRNPSSSGSGGDSPGSSASSSSSRDYSSGSSGSSSSSGGYSSDSSGSSSSSGGYSSDSSGSSSSSSGSSSSSSGSSSSSSPREAPSHDPPSRPDPPRRPR
ncbi:MAG: hypothetical protein HY551_04470 [Elusimicrobia bacterium]|nr:hypothetical protein [Elusimicrobiota bacterium]